MEVFHFAPVDSWAKHYFASRGANRRGLGKFEEGQLGAALADFEARREGGRELTGRRMLTPCVLAIPKHAARMTLEAGDALVRGLPLPCTGAE